MASQRLGGRVLPWGAGILPGSESGGEKPVVPAEPSFVDVAGTGETLETLDRFERSFLESGGLIDEKQG